jgi:hypothetical protein
MLDIPASDYQVSALEVASSSASIEALAKMEAKAVQPTIWAQCELIRWWGT